MATRKKTGKRSTAKKAALDAVQLLKADHRQVSAWFEMFEKATSASRKKTLAKEICKALTVHMEIEEKMFYPAFLKATEDKDMHHEAVVEHDGAKFLIRAIKASSPSNDYFDSKVHVLSEMIKHHVKEEEQKGGMFAQAKESEMDLEALGVKMAARKKELMARR